MLLYFNFWYFPFWLVTHIITTNMKMAHMDLMFQVLTVFMLIVMVALECARLYLGYVGNLTEKVPELAGYWLVTVVLQLPMLCFFLFVAGQVHLAVEVVVDIIMAVFLVLEALVGVGAISSVSKQQALRFRAEMSQAADQSSFSAATATSLPPSAGGHVDTLRRRVSAAAASFVS